MAMTDLERQQSALIAAMRAAQPEDELPRLALAMFLCDHVPADGAYQWAVEALRAGRVPLTSVDKTALTLLSGCRFLPGSFDKRFARDIDGQVSAAGPHASLTPKQYWCLWRMVHRYRRQIKSATINDLAERAANNRSMRDPNGLKQGELFAAVEVATS
jgi:hypothetical protein